MDKEYEIWSKQDEVADKVIISFVLSRKELMEALTSWEEREYIISKKMGLVQQYLRQFVADIKSGIMDKKH